MAIGISSTHNASIYRLINHEIAQSSERLISGKAINSAKDDAAGLAIVSRLDAISRELDVGVRNASDAISTVEVADSAISGIESGLQRLRELSLQSANGILSDKDREAISVEAEQIKSEIHRVIETTEFNGRHILSDDQSFTVQLGGGNDHQIRFATQSIQAQFTRLNLDDIDLSTQSGANSAVTTIDHLFDATTSARSEYGAVSNRLSSAISHLDSRQVAVSSSQSRIEDTDYVAESVNLNKYSLLEKATIAVQAQANASSETVLALLR